MFRYHLTSPIDNSAVIGVIGEPKDIYQPDEIMFEWDALPEADYYQIIIDEYIEPIQYVDRVLDVTTSDVEIIPDLPLSGEERFYLVHLFAYSSSDLLVGKLMVPYENGYGWDYRFRIFPVAEVIQEISDFYDAAVEDARDCLWIYRW